MSLAMHDGPAGIVVPGIGPARIGIKLQNNQTTLHDTTISIKCPAGGVLTIYWGDGTASAVTCNNVLNAYTHTYTAQARYTILVVGTTTLISDFRAVSQSWISGPLSEIVRGLGSALTTLHLYSTAVSGDVSALSRFTGLSALAIYATSVSGNISALAALTALTYLGLGSTQVTGDIAVAAGMPLLTTLRLDQNAGVTGDIASIAPRTALTIIHLYSCPALTYTTPTALPPWNGATIWLYSSGLSSTEVDGFLIDLADGCGTTGTRVLKIAGTNAARTSASDAAKAALLAAGWTVEVNE